MATDILYQDPQWSETLQKNGLTSFEQWWNLQLTCVDEGNVGRGEDGWSRVYIHTLKAADGTAKRVIIKRQQNYRSRTLSHPLRGIPTFVKEYRFIQLYEKLRVPATTAVYCATREIDGALQAILVTEFLEGYRSLEEILESWSTKSRRQRDEIITSVARLIAKLHNEGLEHRCLFPKHIFVPDDITRHSSRLIDLEKTRGKPWSAQRRLRDLAALVRRTPQVGTRDRVRFFHRYFNSQRMDNNAKNLWRKIIQRRKKNN